MIVECGCHRTACRSWALTGKYCTHASRAEKKKIFTITSFSYIKMNQVSKCNSFESHGEWSFSRHYSARLAQRHWDLVWKLKSEAPLFVMLKRRPHSYYSKPPSTPAWLFLLTTPSSHALRGQMSEVPRLIVMIMSLRLQGVGWGFSAGENIFRS